MLAYIYIYIYKYQCILIYIYIYNIFNVNNIQLKGLNSLLRAMRWNRKQRYVQYLRGGPNAKKHKESQSN